MAGHSLPAVVGNPRSPGEGCSPSPGRAEQEISDLETFQARHGVRTPGSAPRGMSNSPETAPTLCLQPNTNLFGAATGPE